MEEPTGDACAGTYVAPQLGLCSEVRVPPTNQRWQPKALTALTSSVVALDLKRIKWLLIIPKRQMVCAPDIR